MSTYEGARWLRADLHVHSPFDPTRRFGEDVRRAIEAANQGDVRLISEITDRFLDSCVAAGLDIVAVTDHNMVDGLRWMRPRLLERAQEARASGLSFPVIFPGIEITAGGERPIHFLLLLPHDGDLDLADRLVAHLFGPAERFDGDIPLSTNTSVDVFLERLRAFCNPPAGERDDLPFLVIPAHMDQGQGLGAEGGAYDPGAGTLFDEMRGQVRQRAFVRIEWHAFEVRREFGRLPEAFRDLICEWFVRRRGRRWSELTPDEKARIRGRSHWPLVMGSDPSAYGEIGRRSTWLKMARPSLEGIRLALLDPVSRLRPGSEPAPGATYPHIKSIHVVGSDFFDDFKVDFSPNLNTIIGGRGTGKSTVLEFIRWGLDRARSEDLPTGEVARAVESLLSRKDARDFGQTPGMILPETSVELEVAIATTTYRVRRDENGIQVTDPTDWIASERLDVRTLINPRILSQGQIADIARDPAAQLAELDATIPEVTRDFALTSATITTELERRQAELRRMSSQQALIPALETELRTTADKISFLEQGENQVLLQRMAALRAEQQWLSVAARALDERRTAHESESLDISAAEAALPAAPQQGPSAVWLGAVESRVRDQLQASVAAATDRAAQLAATRAAIETERRELWEPEYRAASQSFAALQEQLKHLDVQLSQHRALITRRLEIESQLDPLRRVSGRIAAARQQVQEAWRSLRDLHLDRAAQRGTAAAQLREHADDIRAYIVPFGDADGLRRRRDEWFGGTGLQERDWEQIVGYVYSSSNGVADRWRDVIDALEEDVDATATLGRPLDPTQSTVQSTIGPSSALTRHFFNALTRTTRARVDVAAQYLMEDAIETHVRDASGEFKPIGQGSLGQRATAVLSLLLSSGEQPLIIDQPEEDLDNSYIYDVVVDLVRDRKFTRQLILATHNPNIPVNGDAEQIVAVAVQNRLGVVATTGSIDIDPVKETVSRVLEGSTEAFQLRAERYGF